MTDAMVGANIDQLQKLRVQGNQVDTKGSRRHRPGCADLKGEQLRRHGSRSNYPEATGIGNGGDQVSLRDPGHRPAHYRDLATEEIAPAHPQAIELAIDALALGAPRA